LHERALTGRVFFCNAIAARQHCDFGACVAHETTETLSPEDVMRRRRRSRKMNSLYDTVGDRARKRVLYNRTVAELRATNIDTRLDLDIYYGDIPAIASRAVYGR
jgi:hypothetical protein